MRINKNLRILILTTLILYNLQIKGQQKKTIESLKQKMSLNDILNTACKNSLDAFKAKQQYSAGYWKFRSFKSSVLPTINLELAPLSYNQSVSKRYDSENNIDVYRPQQTLNSYGNIAITQNVKATGATMFVNSSFNRLVNYGDFDSKDYAATPVQIGLVQPIMAFNILKWQNKIAPLQFERAKKEYLNELQSIKLKAVDYFFNWALANTKLELAKENMLTAEKIFTIGKKRYDLGSIEKDDILNLELDLYNAQTSLTQNIREVEKTVLDLKLFLRDSNLFNLEPELPILISNMQIDANDASNMATANNPDYFNLKIKKMEAQRDLDKVIKENRFDLSLTGTYGLNQNGNTPGEAYNNLLEQKMVAVQFSIPILDWGERRGNIKTARMNNEVSEIEIQQEEDKLNQQLILKVIDFNLQQQLVIGALRNSEISKSSYEITEKRFLSGSIDLLRLTSARKTWQSASENYVTSLYNYWKFYYEIEQLTLYDFQNSSIISQNFDEIIGK